MATPSLKPSLSEQNLLEKRFQEEINYHRRENGRPPLPRNTAIKFLRARKFDLNRALQLYLAHEEVREKDNLQYIDPFDKDLQTELSTEKFTLLPHRDLNGAAVALFTARLHFPATTTHTSTLKGLVYQLDTALESVDTQNYGLVFIYDMTDSKSVNFDYDLSKKILNMLKGAYPARLKKVLIVTAPLWFKALFNILRMFVREKLRERVFIISQENLSQYLPQDHIIHYFGSHKKIPTPHHTAWIQLCQKVATNQPYDMSKFFISLKRPHNSLSGSDQESISRSTSSDLDQRFTDLDSNSETSKETINEKYNHEACEKERQADGSDSSEKEVAVEKDGSGLMNGKRRKISGSNTDDHKRNSELVPAGNGETNHTQEEKKKKRPQSSGSNILDDSIHMPDDKGYDLHELVRRIRMMKKKGLYSEYARIKMEPPTGSFNISKAPHNLPKNRYTDVLTLDESRVCLPGEDLDLDYINGNYVDGYCQKNAYICTQGPLPKTFVDFWRMVWSNQSHVIVMTTRTIEKQRMKCGQYWPHEVGTDEQFDEFIVYNNNIKHHKDFIETTLLLHNTKTGESREISHLQFIAWPDYGIPPATGFLDYLFHVRHAQEEGVQRMGEHWGGHPLGPPIVVHCSAGIGRTGTFVTIDISLRRLDDIKTVDIRETVRRIRSQRAFSIQMPDQYVFCHLAVIDHAIRQGLLKELEADPLGSDSDSD